MHLPRYTISSTCTCTSKSVKNLHKLLDCMNRDGYYGSVLQGQTVNCHIFRKVCSEKYVQFFGVTIPFMAWSVITFMHSSPPPQYYEHEKIVPIKLWKNFIAHN